MRNNIIIILAEIKKQKRNYYNSLELYLSLLIWPILTSATTYFTYSSFNINILSLYGISSFQELLIFVVVGALGYNCFWSMIQGALSISHERENGTLEIIFMSPANRLSLLYGRALGGVLVNIWMFLIFTIMITIFYNGMNLTLLLKWPFCFLILLFSATIWGAFINSIFLISRDINFIFTLCDEPMHLLSGALLPIKALPSFFRVISGIFPLTYCLIIMRQILSNGGVQVKYLIYNMIVSSILILCTYLFSRIAEKNNRENGNFGIY